jgi:hypothetical protein
MVETFVLGTAVKLTAILEDDLPSGGTVKASIYDSAETLVVNNAEATALTDNVFEYIYQSTDNDIAGCYRVVFTVTVGGYSSKSTETIKFQDVT